MASLTAQGLANAVERYFAKQAAGGKRDRVAEAKVMTSWSKTDWSTVVYGDRNKWDSAWEKADTPGYDQLTRWQAAKRIYEKGVTKTPMTDRLPHMETEEQLWFALGLARGWLVFHSVCSEHKDRDDECAQCAIGHWMPNAFNGKWAFRPEVE